MKKRLLAALLAAAITCTSLPYAFAAEDPATRSEVCAMLLSAADDYHPGVQASDIMHGDPDGSLRGNEPVTRAEALVMLSRAFGELAKPTGENARLAYPASNFTDLPDWAKTELQNVLDAGIVAGTSATTFSPSEFVTEEQMNLFIDRVFALEGTNAKDDFYAAINKTDLATGIIKPGRMIGGTLYDKMDAANADIAAIIEEIVSGTPTKGSGEEKIKALYTNYLDWDARNKAGISPIKPYLEAIDAAQSLDDLMAVDQTLSNEYATSLFFGFGLAIDAKDSTRYSVTFSGLSPSLTKDIYAADSGKQKDAYIKYITTLFRLGGYSDAAAQAARFWSVEKQLSVSMLDQQDYGDVDKTYNLFTMQQLRDLFPSIDLDAVYTTTGLQSSDHIIVTDKGLLQANAVLFGNADLDTLKTVARLNLLGSFGNMLSRDFQTAAETYQQDFVGTTGTMTDEEYAAQIVQYSLGDYLGEAYVKRHFTAKAKADVEDMVQDMIAVYKERIAKLDWMTETTKQKAIEKLSALNIKVGYPDSWTTYYDNTALKTASEGGSYLDNMVSLSRASRDIYVKWQNEPVDKSTWAMNVFTVNACYVPPFNEIVFPAAILQPPMYDVNASREQNLGSIGYVIAHEITHAFDNNGAKYDKNGNAADWWTAEDYAAFQKLCNQVITYYDGMEAAPGITCSGALTLSENIADLGAVACITEIVSREKNPDYKTLYESVARTWSSVSTRDARTYLAQLDVHAPEKLRVNRVLQSCAPFYESFGITESDGMWLDPAQRVSIW